MRILYTADIHVNPDHLRHMVRAALRHRVDALIVGGDIVPHDLGLPPGADTLAAQAVYLESVLIPALEQLKDRASIEIFIDMGNDDFATHRPILEQCDGCLLHLLHMQRHALTEQVDLVGYMMVPPTPFTRKDWEKPDSRRQPYAPGNQVRLEGFTTLGGRKRPVKLNLESPETIESDLARLSARINKPFILAAHCPPYGTPLDLIGDGTHVGSLSLRNYIEKWAAAGQLKASLHGHIHESPMISGTNHCRINDALCINPGQGHTLRYVILELDDSDGTIRLQHTTP